MKAFFLRTLLLLFLVLLQLSFFDILFPWFRAPLFLLGMVVIFSLVRGFPGALMMTLPLTLLFDAVSRGMVSWFSLYAVIISYGISFLSRRLLIEHRGLGLGLYAGVAFGGALFYQLLFAFVVSGFSTPAESLLKALFPSSESLIFSLVFFLPLFLFLYFALRHFEGYLAEQSQRQFRNIR